MIQESNLPPNVWMLLKKEVRAHLLLLLLFWRGIILLEAIEYLAQFSIQDLFIFCYKS